VISRELGYTLYFNSKERVTYGLTTMLFTDLQPADERSRLAGDDRDGATAGDGRPAAKPHWRRPDVAQFRCPLSIEAHGSWRCLESGAPAG
jgi:hypothetical protein